MIIINRLIINNFWYVIQEILIVLRQAYKCIEPTVFTFLSWCQKECLECQKESQSLPSVNKNFNVDENTTFSISIKSIRVLETI